VIRYLRNVYERLPVEHGEKTIRRFWFLAGEDHPLYHVIPDKLPRVRKPYAWYLPG
jgi:hypothetical protein